MGVGCGQAQRRRTGSNVSHPIIDGNVYRRRGNMGRSSRHPQHRGATALRLATPYITITSTAGNHCRHGSVAGSPELMDSPPQVGPAGRFCAALGSTLFGVQILRDLFHTVQLAVVEPESIATGAPVNNDVG